MKKIIESLSWIGVLMILLAYALVSFSFVDTDRFAYHILNRLGAIFIAIDAYKSKNYQPGVLNTIWSMIALIAIMRIIL